MGALPGETGSGGKSTAGTLFNLRQAAIALPGVGYQSPLPVGLHAGELAAEKFGLSLAQVALLGGVAGAAILGVSAGLRLITENSERASKAMIESSDTFYQVGLAALTSTRQQLEARRQSAQAELTFAEAFAKTAYQNVMDYILAHPEVTYPITGIVAEAFEGMGGTLGGLQGSADKANEKLRAAQNEVAALTIVLNGNSTATETAAAALKRLTDAQADSADRAVAINQMTVEERQKQAAAERAEVDVLTFLIQNTDLTTDAAEQLSVRAGELNVDIRKLEGRFLTFADIAQAVETATLHAATALTSHNDALLELMTGETEARQALREAQNEAAVLAEESAAKVLQIQTEAGTKEVELRSKWAQQLGDKLAEIQRRSDERIRQLKEKDSLSIEEAVARGDQAQAQSILRRQALTIQQEERQRDQAKEDTRKQLDTQYGEQLASLRAATEKQLDTQRSAFQKAAQQNQQAIDRAKADLENAIAGQAAIERAAQSERLRQEAVHQNQMIGAAALGAQAILGITGGLFVGIAAQARAGLAEGNIRQSGNMLGSGKTYEQYISASAQGYNYGAGPYPASFTSDTPFPSFDGGGIVTRPGLAYLGKVGERYYPPLAEKQALPAGGAGNTLIFQIDATGSAMRREEFQQVIEGALDRREVRIVQRLTQNYREAQ